MNRMPLIFSLICILISCAITAYAWVTLPVLENYPLHWNAQGEPDRFGDRSDVLVNLIIMPAMTIFLAALFYFLPKIEPLRKNLESSRSAYNTVWMMTMAFSVGITALIASAYGNEAGAALGASPRVIVIGLSIFFIGIGNVLGKVRQNFMFGIRTPWTLSSELSWEKTHRLGGWLFVLAGLVSIVAALLAPKFAFHVFTASIVALVLFVFIYSFVIWKSDPQKRQ